MIAGIAFEREGGRIRTLRFARRTSLPLATACTVAERLRGALRDLFGEGCDLVIGEPTPLSRNAWSALARDARLFLTCGRPSDVVLVVPPADARRLVLQAFGEADAGGAVPAEAGWSALERCALERIATRCAAAFDPLCTQREAAARPVEPGEVSSCAAYFDIRLRAPVALTLGVAVVRDVPDPPPAPAFASAVLEAIGVEVRAVLGEARIAAWALAELAPGAMVRLDTKVGDPISLNVAGNHVAFGIPGVVALRNAIRVLSVPGAHLR